MSELMKVVRRLQPGKVTRDGDIAIECFKVLASEPGSALQPLLDFFNECVSKKSFPREWTTARVVMIFKKKDAADCET